MPKDWTGDLVGLMHNKKISSTQLANQLGVTLQYVSMVLNGKREPAGAEEKFKAALEVLIAKQTRKDITN